MVIRFCSQMGTKSAASVTCSSTQVQVVLTLPCLYLKTDSEPISVRTKAVRLYTADWRSNFLACSNLAVEVYLDYDPKISAYPLALPRINHLPWLCILCALEQLHTTFDQHWKRVPGQVQNKHNKAQTAGSHKPFSSKLADTEGWHLFLINNILPSTTCVVPINIPNGFRSFWPLRLMHLRLGFKKPKSSLWLYHKFSAVL